MALGTESSNRFSPTRVPHKSCVLQNRSHSTLVQVGSLRVYEPNTVRIHYLTSSSLRLDRLYHPETRESVRRNGVLLEIQ